MKNFKKIFAVVLTVCMICSVCINSFAAETAADFDNTADKYALKFSATEGKPGDSITASAYLYDTTSDSDISFKMSALAQITGTFCFPDVLEFEDMTVSSDLAKSGVAIDTGYTMDASEDVGRNCILFMVRFNGSETLTLGADVAIFDVKFKIKDNAANGTYNFSLFEDSEDPDMSDVVSIADANAENSISAPATLGTVTVKSSDPEPTKAETKVESEKVRDLTYDTDKTSHFFEGIYSVTPNDEKIATFGVNIKSKADTSKTKTFEKKGLTVEGGAKIVLRLALINDDVDILNDLAGDVFYTAE